MVNETVLTPTPRALAAAIQRIAAVAQPTRIIAFGSRARGDHQKDSDVDLLVVLPRGSSAGNLSADLHQAVGVTGFSKDIIVSEEGFLERCASSPNSAQAEALRQGLVLYENGRTHHSAIEKICR